MKSRSVSAVLVAALLGTVAVPARAQTASEARRRDALQRKRAAVAAQLDALEASDRELEAAVQALDGEVARGEAQAAAAEQAASAAAEAAAQAGERLAATQRELAALREAVKQRAVQAYVHSGGTDVSSLLGAGSLDEASRRRTFIEVVSGRDRDVVDRLRAAEEDQAVQREQADAARARAAARRDAIRSELARLSAARASQRRLRDALDQRIAAFRAEVDGLRREEANLAAIIRARQSPARASRGGSDAPAGSVSRAGLIWPVRGTVTSEYGPRWGRMHEGIDIAAPTGTPIRAAKAGRVIFVGQQGGYGNMTLIDHGDGFVTAYPHQSRFGTTEGASVAQGEVIGYVGCSGSCTGPHLHFETRVNGEAQNPRRYLP